MSRNGYKNKQRPGPYPSGSRDWSERRSGQSHSSSNEDIPTSAPSSMTHGGSGSSMSNEMNRMTDVSPQRSFERNRQEKKFANRARLYVGNLPRGISEAELKLLFDPHGEMTQVFIEKDKNFGFVRMAYRSNAEKAVAALNGQTIKGREIRVRFAASSCSVKVTNLHPTVSNELLHDAFSQFGEVEFAVVVTDERGKSLGHGLVDFAKKSQALTAIERCRYGCFLLTKSPIPISVAELVRENEEEGLPEKQISKSSQYTYEREAPPRMAQPGSPEFDFAMRFKALYENEKARRDELDSQLKETRNQLETEMEQFKHHEHANVLRLQLAEYQKEQMRLQQRLQRHEEFIKGGHPPIGALPPPPHSHFPHMPPPLPPGTGGPPLMPQPLLSLDNDGRPDGFAMMGSNPLLPPRGGPHMPPDRNQPAFLLPAPVGQQMPPPS